MFIATIAIVAGFFGLIWSADQFVAGAAGIARSFGMAPIMIGLTIVALGTSMPEIIVSINAALEGSGEMAVGNAVGSNLANIGLVLGISALITPIPVDARLAKREIPLLVLVTLATGLLLHDNYLGRLDGIILLTALVAVFTFLVKSKSHQPDAAQEADVEHIPDISRARAWWLFLMGLAILILSSRILVWGAQQIAHAFGISELVIGLTVVAVGTSLPEMATTAASAIKGHHDIAIGNVVGSNLFNLLAVMAMPAVINPITLEPAVFRRDYVAMTAITLLLAALVFLHRLWSIIDKKAPATVRSRHARIGRLEGGLLFLAYAAYYYRLFSVST